ncbi:MAG: hypothetical protein ACX937_15245 [Roseicyclus sp.]
MIDEELALFADWAKMRDCRSDVDEMEVGDLSLRLRRMLIDGNCLLHLVNRRHKRKVRFPSSPCSRLDLSASTTLHAFPKNMFSRDAAFSSTLDNFLSFTILEINGVRISIREVIKLVANNLGGVHFDTHAATQIAPIEFKKDETVRALRLAMFHIAKATSAGVEELASLCSPFPDYNEFLGHYSAGDQKAHVLHFESHQWMEVQYPENTRTSAISILAVLEPLPQERKLSTLISFALRDLSGFEVALSSEGDVKAFYSRGKKRIDLRLDDQRKIRPIGKRVYLKFSIEKNGLNTLLEIDLHGRKKKESFEYPIGDLDLQRCVIGGRQNGKLGAGFLLSELCILSKNDSITNDNIIRYFQYRYLR